MVNQRDDVPAVVGAQVRILRRDLDLSARELARRARLSTSMLSKIETGQTSPSITTLVQLADALDVPVARLFAGFEDRKDCSLVRAGEGLVVERRGTREGHTYRLLGHTLSGDIYVEPYFVTTTNKAKPYSSFQHRGVEFMYVLKGTMTYRYAEKTVVLSPGDSMLFDPTAIHGPEAVSGEPVEYLSIVMTLRT